VTILSPLRHPDSSSAHGMTRRGWWLVVLNLLIPGSVQVLAGNRRLGRFGLLATLALWVVAIAFVVAWLIAPTVVFTVLTLDAALLVAQVVLVAYVVLWMVLTVDTLRLVHLIRAVPTARVFIAAFATLALVGVAGTASYAAYLVGVQRGMLGGIFSAGPVVPPVDGRYNILLLGGDAGPDREGMRPDSISVVSIDATTGKSVTIGLPRDLENAPFAADSPLAKKYPKGYGYRDKCDVDMCQLNSIYVEAELKSSALYPNAVASGSQPGIEAMRDVAEGVTGLTIQYYVLIDMQGFADLVDALGGVTVTVAERVPMGAGHDEQNNPVKITAWIEPGLQKLDGFHTLWYARSRYLTSDYDRMARQRQVQEAILQQVNPATVLTRFQDVAKAGVQVVKTDVPQAMLGYFVQLALKSKDLPGTSVALVPPQVDPADPDYVKIRGMVQAAIAPPTPTPSR